MRLNTVKSIKLARRVKGRYGTWQAVREASSVQNGVFVVETPKSADTPGPVNRQRVPA